MLYTPEDIAADVEGLLQITSATKLDRETPNGVAIDAFVSAVRPLVGDHDARDTFPQDISPKYGNSIGLG